MKKVLLLCTLTAFGTVAGCAKKKVPAVSKVEATTVKEFIKTPFTPPQDSLLTQRSIIQWKSINAALDSLALAYQDSFKIISPDMQPRLEKGFQHQQDQICMRAGLASGYEEYSFITTALTLSKNRAFADSMAISIR